MTAERAIVILGGTFDPVHNAHLRVAWEASETFDAHVRLLPAHVPPHRPAPVASAEHRVAMLRAALAGQDRLLLDERELRRASASYTIDTLREFRVEFGARQSLILLLGADAFAGLPSWHRWQDLFALTHLAIMRRPGHGAPLSPVLAAAIEGRHAATPAILSGSAHGKVFDFQVTPLEISASAVRAQLAAGREPRWLVPEALLNDPALLAPYRRADSTSR